MNATSSNQSEPDEPRRASGLFKTEPRNLDPAREPSALLGSSKVVLIVDDDDDLAESLAVVLDEHGFLSKRCEDAMGALQTLEREELPDLILLDLMMPRMNGWEFRALQRRNAAWASIPVIALTGNTSAQAAVMDADAFITKPVQASTLMLSIRTVLAERDRKQAEARARELERLTSLSVLASGLAHEINNPLSVALGYIAVARRASGQLARIASSHEGEVATQLRRLDDALQQIEESNKRVAAVVKEVGSFARVTGSEAVDVAEALDGSVRLLANQIRLKARLERSYEPVPRVFASPAGLAQLFLDVLIRAVHAIPEGSPNDNVIRLSVSARGEHDVLITISDTGRLLKPQGARPSALHDPHLRGTLEPSIAHRLVQELGGTVELASADGAGTTVLISLPGMPVAPELPPLSPARPSQAPVRPRVLVIDDEPRICSLLELMLQDRYQVEVFANPVTALARLQGGAPVDVILCDLMMPELTGMDLYERLRHSHPALASRMVFMTGGTFSDRSREFVAKRGTYLQKPFSEEAVQAAIARVVDWLGTRELPR
jgi:CheY-like chemotaxis protein